MAESESRLYIEKVLELAGIDIDMESNPAIIAKVLNEDMMLAGFEPAQKLLKDALNHPISLKPMFEKTIKGIMTKQPAICEFIKEAVEANLIVKAAEQKSKDAIIRSIHHAYVLNELTMEIVTNIDFVFEIQEYLLSQREKFGISKNFIDALETLKVIYKGSMFEPTKIIGMDMVYRARALDRRKGFMTEEDINAQIDGLRLNILEASITDKNAGYMDNAIVGAVLSSIPPKTVSLSEHKNKVMLFHLSRKWVSLYETWNLAFCLGNLAYMPVLLPKLLIPSVIDAEPNEYLITRSAALWMSTLFHQFSVLTKREDIRVPNNKELAEIWGRINLKYAYELAKEEDSKEADEYNDILKITMGEIMESMKKSLSEMPLTEDEAERLVKIYS